jgi:hypothetical protein
MSTPGQKNPPGSAAADRLERLGRAARSARVKLLESVASRTRDGPRQQALILAHEIERLNARRGSDTHRQAGYDEAAWPAAEAVDAALQVLAQAKRAGRGDGERV